MSHSMEVLTATCGINPRRIWWGKRVVFSTMVLYHSGAGLVEHLVQVEDHLTILVICTNDNASTIKSALYAYH